MENASQSTKAILKPLKSLRKSTNKVLGINTVSVSHSGEEEKNKKEINKNHQTLALPALSACQDLSGAHTYKDSRTKPRPHQRAHVHRAERAEIQASVSTLHPSPFPLPRRSEVGEESEIPRPSSGKPVPRRLPWPDQSPKTGPSRPPAR